MATNNLFASCIECDEDIEVSTLRLGFCSLCCQQTPIMTGTCIVKGCLENQTVRYNICQQHFELSRQAKTKFDQLGRTTGQEHKQYGLQDLSSATTSTVHSTARYTTHFPPPNGVGRSITSQLGQPWQNPLLPSHRYSDMLVVG